MLAYCKFRVYNYYDNLFTFSSARVQTEVLTYNCACCAKAYVIIRTSAYTLMRTCTIWPARARGFLSSCLSNIVTIHRGHHTAIYKFLPLSVCTQVQYIYILTLQHGVPANYQLFPFSTCSNNLCKSSRLVCLGYYLYS